MPCLRIKGKTNMILYLRDVRWCHYYHHYLTTITTIKLIFGYEPTIDEHQNNYDCHSLLLVKYNYNHYELKTVVWLDRNRNYINI